MLHWSLEINGNALDFFVFVHTRFLPSIYDIQEIHSYTNRGFYPDIILVMRPSPPASDRNVSLISK